MSLGRELTTLFAFFEIAFRPTTALSMRNDEKFCIIRRPDVQKHYYGVVIPKLLYTRRDRSRGIRDEATACEPKVVLCE